MAFLKMILKDLAAYRASLIIIFVPLILSPILILLGYPDNETNFVNNGTNETNFQMNATSQEVKLEGAPARCLYVVLLMGIYWMFEVMPLAVTALLPVVLFPMLTIMPSNSVCTSYLTDTNFLFVGGLIVAVAVEKSNLHQRIALKVLTIVGSRTQWVMLGFMSVTAFLSMWISNTATTAMMLPIAIQVIAELFPPEYKNPGAARKEPENEASDGTMLLTPTNGQNNTPWQDGAADVAVAADEEEGELQLSKMSPTNRRAAKGLVLCICFAANIGGTATVTGTPPNLVMVGMLNDELYAKKDTGLSFASWMAFATVPMIITVILAWLIMALFYLGFKKFLLGCKCAKRKETKLHDPVYELIMRRYRSLPRWSFSEVTVLIAFIVLLLLWIFRSPKPLPGYSVLFDKVDDKKKTIKYYTDATSAILIAILLFALPAEMPDFFCTRGRDKKRPAKSRRAIMDWPTMQAKFPWSVVLLLGGGLALAGGVKRSGLSDWLGMQLRELRSLPLLAIQTICILVTMLVTNITSNTVTASIFVPIVNRLALELFVNPLALIVPVTLAASFAFILPVGTPPNAIVFASGILTVPDMAKIGSIMTVMCLILTVFTTNTYIGAVLSLSEFPSWAEDSLPDIPILTAMKNSTLI